VGNHTLKQQFPALFLITLNKHISVASVFSTIALNISFCRCLTCNNLIFWYNLVAQVAHNRLNTMENKFRWGLHQSYLFSASSLYGVLISNNRVRYGMSVWKLKLPLKIKIFMCYLKRGVVLIKDNLIRRNWKGSKTCVFCSHPGTIQHLFFYCLVAKFIWRAVHITFNIDIPISVMHLFNDWANGMGPHMGKGLLIGAAALCWTMWTSRNDIVFENASTKTYM
jgi:hypothetical protein